MPADRNGDMSAPEAPRRTRTLNAVQDAKRLHPMTLLQRVLVSLPALAFILYPALASPDAEAWISLLMGLLYGLVALPAIVLQYLRFSYRITPNEISIQSGVLKRKHRSIPIERIQNIQIEQSLLPRLLGTAKVKIETAGSSGTEGVLEYVSLDEAHTIRQAIRSFQRQQAGMEAAVEPKADEAESRADQAETQMLFTMSLPRVLLSGAFRFSLLYIALIFSILQFIPEEEIILWLRLSRGELEGLINTAINSPWLTGLITIFVAGFFAWLTGIAVNLNKYYNFKLWLDGDKLRLRRGLLTLAEGTIPLQKVQALILRTNPLMHQFGWYTLEVQTIGLDVEEQGHRVVVPFAQKSEILDLAQRIRPFELPEKFAPVSMLTIRRHVVRYAVGLVALVVIAAYFWPSSWWAPGNVAFPWWMLSTLPLLLGYAVLHYRHHGYRLRDDGFYVRRGVFKQYIWIIPTEKFHVFYTTASIFQRRLALKTLFIDTAGAATFAYPDVIDLPAREADRTLHRVYEQFHTLYTRRIEQATGSSATRLSASERPSIPEEELNEM